MYHYHKNDFRRQRPPPLIIYRGRHPKDTLGAHLYKSILRGHSKDILRSSSLTINRDGHSMDVSKKSINTADILRDPSLEIIAPKNRLREAIKRHVSRNSHIKN
jgi:hypothetical protein